MTDREKIRAEIKGLYDEIDLCIGELIKGRVNHNETLVANAQHKMESLMVQAQQVLSCISDAIEEPVSKDLEEAAKNHAAERYRTTRDEFLAEKCKWSFVVGANWQKQKLWKDAQGDDLPEIDREVIAFQGRKVVIAHRPNPKGWDGKSLSTGKVEHYTPQTYDKGGWNMEGITYWLDVELPEGIE